MLADSEKYNIINFKIQKGSIYALLNDCDFKKDGMIFYIL